MCTAVSVSLGSHFFGRNLDGEKAFCESVIITPRKYPFNFRCHKSINDHYALMGMGLMQENYPLYYEAINEKGLSAAALRFPESEYFPEKLGLDNIASFEFIPWILCQCADVKQCRRLLMHTNITGISFNEKYPATELHWFICDKEQAITVECAEGEINVYENSAAVLTNSPALPFQLFNLNNYMHLSEKPPCNNIAQKYPLCCYSRGMGALGLPGDMSSMSRFVRCFFMKEKLLKEKEYEKNVSQFFHILDSVSQKKGSVKTEKNEDEFTCYTSCYDTQKGICFLRSYYDSTVRSVDMFRQELNTSHLICFDCEERPMRENIAKKIF